MVYSLDTLRTMALHAQGLASKTNPKKPTSDDIYNAIDQMGCLQIDTLQMVHRSQYVAIWSRLGKYDPADLDVLLSGNGKDKNTRRVFEYWYHAAAYIPLSEYWTVQPKMRHHRENSFHWATREFGEDGVDEILNMVIDRIRDEGALRSADFKTPQREKSGWWDWKPAKTALEILYFEGRLMVSDRPKFQKVYDLAERVLPDWVESREASQEEADAHMLERISKVLGICLPLHIPDYFTLASIGRSKSRHHLDAMLKDGRLVMVEGETMEGTAELVVHRDNLPMLEQIADGAIRTDRTTFLSPFDALWYPRRRDMLFWNFYQTVEMYVPEPKRIWGYYSLPILWRGQFIGRFDPKLERKHKRLHIKHLHLEEGIKPNDKMVKDVADAMKDFLAFHHASEVVIDHSNPPEFGEMLMKALQ